MYTAAKGGSGHRSTNARSGKKKSRRRRKKNPSTVTIALIAGAGALALGGGIAYAQYRKKKKAAQLPPVTPGGGGTKPGGGGRPSGGGKGKVEAPAFPFTQSEAAGLEDAWSVTAVAEAMPASGGPITRSVDAITDDAFFEIYQIRKIPPNAAASWKPFIDSWFRIRSKVKSQVDAYNAAAVA